jgi:hypothetical protein
MLLGQSYIEVLWTSYCVSLQAMWVFKYFRNYEWIQPMFFKVCQMTSIQYEFFFLLERFFFLIIILLLAQWMYPIIYAQFEWIDTFIPPYLIGYYLWLSMWVFVYKPNFICLHESKSIIRFWIRLSKEAFHNITYFGNFDTCLSNI